MIIKLKADYISCIHLYDDEYMLVIINMVGDIPIKFKTYESIELTDCNGEFVSDNGGVIVSNIMDTTRIHKHIKRITHISYSVSNNT